MSDAGQLRPLGAFRRNVHSQLGEDGIIEEALGRMAAVSSLSGWCVEFGAWDGIHLSNTCNLIRNRAYKAVLIEGDPKKHKLLCRNIPSPDVLKVCVFVSFQGDNTLDRILSRTPIPRDFDVLSIDIDGCDYFILESLEEYSPKLVCIEYNSTIPNEVEFVQPRDFAVKQGASPRSIAALAESKGYVLVATTECNLILVRSEFRAAVVGSGSSRLEDLRDDSAYKTYIFTGYDGTVLSSRQYLSMPWHGLEIDQKSLQQLPRYLRRFPDDYSGLQKVAFLLLSVFRFPRKLRELVAARLDALRPGK